MKKILLAIIVAIIPVATFAQAQITTKKMKLEDFPEKVMKVVLSGNVFIDGTVEEAVKNVWTISPFEFCTMEEFEALKGKEDYYFLMTVLGQFRKEVEPGLTMLSLVKGGKGSDLSLDKMLEVVTVPVCSAEYPSGREIVFIPALINIIQEHVQASMKRDYNAYGGLESNSSSLEAAHGKRVVFAESDISSLADESLLESIKKNDIEIMEDDDVDTLMDEGAANTVVSYSITPYDAAAGSFSYKMLIDAQTHKLYYFRKHRITKNTAPGFLPEDLMRIAKR